MNTITRAIDGVSEKIFALGDAIWDTPELLFQETTACDLLCALMEEEGFTVERGTAGIPTAFTAAYGSGSPRIGILAEYDALSGLSQKAGFAEQAVEPSCGTSGHGCGHNLIAAGTAAAAIGVKAWLEEGHEGTVILYGCPGEEGGSSKTFMARDHVFDDLDCALTFHPGDENVVYSGRSLANIQALFRFHGAGAHAAGAPWMGRSALDAVELMNVGTNFLREHMTPNCRVHYSITNSGGISPNVVQQEAEVLYLVRSPENAELQTLYSRVKDIARGAALMTGTTADVRFIKAVSGFRPNQTLNRVLVKALESAPVPEVKAEWLEKALALAPTYDSKVDLAAERDRFEKGEPLQLIRTTMKPYNSAEPVSFGSTDVSDVSQVCPTAQFNTSTWVFGTPGHSWQATSQGKSDQAHQMTLFAGKVLAEAAADLFLHPDTVAEAKAEFDRREAQNPYQNPIPAGVIPGAPWEELEVEKLER